LLEHSAVFKNCEEDFFHHIWTLIEDGELTWELVKTDFKKEFKTLKALDISKFEARRLYKQRELEIARGQYKVNYRCQ